MDRLERIKYLRAELKHQKELVDCLYLNSKNCERNSKGRDWSDTKYDVFFKSIDFKAKACRDIKAEILILEHAC